MRMNNLVKIGLDVVTATILLTGCASSKGQMNNSTSTVKTAVSSKVNLNQEFKKTTIKLPLTNIHGKTLSQFNVNNYDLTPVIKQLVDNALKKKFIQSVSKDGNSYKIVLGTEGTFGLHTYYYDTKIDTANNNITLSLRKQIDFIPPNGLFATPKLNEDFSAQLTRSVYDVLRELGHVYYFQEAINIKDRFNTSLSKDEAIGAIDLVLDESYERNYYSGTFWKQPLFPHIVNSADYYNNLDRFNKSKYYYVLYENAQGHKLPIVLSLAMYPSKNGTTIKYNADVKYFITTNNRQTITKADIPRIKKFVKNIFK